MQAQVSVRSFSACIWGTDDEITIFLDASPWDLVACSSTVQSAMFFSDPICDLDCEILDLGSCKGTSRPVNRWLCWLLCALWPVSGVADEFVSSVNIDSVAALTLMFSSQGEWQNHQSYCQGHFIRHGGKLSSLPHIGSHLPSVSNFLR